MTQYQLTALPDSTAKVYLYLLELVLEKDKTFNLLTFLKVTKLDKPSLFRELKILSDLEIIEVVIDSEQGKIFFIIYNHSIDINILNWAISTIVIFNQVFFENHPAVMHELVNYLYSPLSLFHFETMNQFVNLDVVPYIKSAKEVADSYENNSKAAKKERARIRKENMKKAETLVSHFYFLLNKSMKRFLTTDLKRTEVYVGVEFYKQYGEYPDELIFKGIEWLMNNPYYQKAVVDMKGFVKHFPKYLNSALGIKKDRRGGIIFS